MTELLKTNDMVLISFIEALLKDEGIQYQVLDQNMSILEGSAGAIPRRVLVDSTELNRARSVLKDAGIGYELKQDQDSE